MFRADERLNSLFLSALILIITAAFGVAQRHFMSGSVARPQVNVRLAAFVERNSQLIPLEKSTVVNPGEVVDWIISNENIGDAPARDYKAVGDIPPGTEFIADSAIAAGANIVFSIDEGKSYSPQPMIEQKQADGSTKFVPAPVSMYNEIRYEWVDPLAQGDKLTASYKVRVK